LYANPKKCSFLSTQVQFLKFVVSTDRVSADPEKIRAIEPELKTIRDVRNFHGLATFYHRFIKRFSTVMAPIADCLKKREFNWSHAATKVFVEIKKRMVSALIMCLFVFFKSLKWRVTHQELE